MEPRYKVYLEEQKKQEVRQLRHLKRGHSEEEVESNKHKKNTPKRKDAGDLSNWLHYLLQKNFKRFLEIISPGCVKAPCTTSALAVYNSRQITSVSSQCMPIFFFSYLAINFTLLFLKKLLSVQATKHIAWSPSNYHVGASKVLENPWIFFFKTCTNPDVV